MPLQQIAYDIPNDIALGILAGTYKRFGGVVRDRKTGAIVKHLRETEVPQKGVRAALQAVKQHPVAAIGIGAAAAAGSAAACIVKKRKARADTPACVLTFEKALKHYLAAVRRGRLDEPSIDRLMAALDGISKAADDAQVPVHLSAKELKALVRIMYDYTGKLAKANAMKLERPRRPSSDSVHELRHYLEIQKKIFSEAA